MTITEKNAIVRMRKEGYGYTRIARELALNENTVKTFCRRNNLTGTTAEIHEPIPPAVTELPCVACGRPVLQSPGRKQKKFCNDFCRYKYWNAHLTDVKRKAMYEFTCPQCGMVFTAYGNRHRKYCSHECYISDRFGGTE